MVFSHLLMTIYISTTQYFCCVACGWNLFYDFKPFFENCSSKSEKYLFFIVDFIFNICLIYYIWGLARILRRTSIFLSTVSSIRKRLSELLCNKGTFEKVIPPYTDALKKKKGFKENLIYTPKTTTNNILDKKQRKGKMIGSIHLVQLM